MIVIFEQDIRKREGRRFTWWPGVFRATFDGRRMCRVWWGLWSISVFRSPGLPDFLHHVAQGKTEWRMR